MSEARWFKVQIEGSMNSRATTPREAAVRIYEDADTITPTAVDGVAIVGWCEKTGNPMFVTDSIMGKELYNPDLKMGPIVAREGYGDE